MGTGWAPERGQRGACSCPHRGKAGGRASPFLLGRVLYLGLHGSTCWGCAWKAISSSTRIGTEPAGIKHNSDEAAGRAWCSSRATARAAERRVQHSTLCAEMQLYVLYILQHAPAQAHHGTTQYMHITHSAERSTQHAAPRPFPPRTAVVRVPRGGSRHTHTRTHTAKAAKAEKWSVRIG